MGCPSAAAAQNSSIVAFHRGIAALQLGQIPEAGADLLLCLNEAYVRPYQWVALALVSLREQDFKAARKYISHAMLGFSNNEAVQLTNEVFGCVPTPQGATPFVFVW